MISILHCPCFVICSNYSLPNKNFIFCDLEGTAITFHDFPGFENEILKFHDFLGFSWPVRTLWDSLWVISNEIEVPATAMEETMISKNGHRIAILIKFYIVSNSCAMKAKKSAKKCTTHSEFQPFTFLFSHLSASSSLVAFCVQQFWMHDNFIKNWWVDGKCRTKKKCPQLPIEKLHSHG